MSFKENVKYITKTFKNTGVDKSLYFAVFLLAIFGIYMIGDASVGSTIRLGPKMVFMNLFKQSAYVILGTLLLFFSARGLKRRFYINNLNKCYIYYGIVYFLILLCRLWNINGSHAWIVIGPMTIQPAEIMKIVLVFILAYCFGELPKKYQISKYLSPRKRQELMNRKFHDCFLIPVLLTFLAAGTVVVYQKDFGSGVILLMICYIVFLAAPDPFYKRIKKFTLIAGVVIVALGVIFGAFFLKAHQLQRIITWLDPLNEKYIYAQGMQVVNGFIAFTNGGLIGRGVGKSVMKFGYIPEAQNDYISAVIAEEFGFFGILAVILVYSYIIFKLYSYAIKMKNDRHKLILVGIASFFFMHLFINLGGVSGLIPMTGVPLLLVSAGGTSTLVTLTAVGIVQNTISRYNKEKLKREAEKSL